MIPAAPAQSFAGRHAADGGTVSRPDGHKSVAPNMRMTTLSEGFLEARGSYAAEPAALECRKPLCRIDSLFGGFGTIGGNGPMEFFGARLRSVRSRLTGIAVFARTNSRFYKFAPGPTGPFRSDAPMPPGGSGTFARNERILDADSEPFPPSRLLPSLAVPVSTILRDAPPATPKNPEPPIARVGGRSRN